MSDELNSLRHWKAEASSLFDGMQDLGRALGLPLGTLITGPDAVKAAESLRFKVRAASALAWAFERRGKNAPEYDAHFWREAADRLRAALDCEGEEMSVESTAHWTCPTCSERVPVEVAASGSRENGGREVAVEIGPRALADVFAHAWTH